MVNSPGGCLPVRHAAAAGPGAEARGEAWRLLLLESRVWLESDII